MASEALGDFRIGEGGLLRRFEIAAHLTSLRAQLIAILVVTWLPAMAMALVAELLHGHREPLLHDLALHVRLLVAAPVFLVLDHMFPRVCRNVLQQLVVQSFVSDDVRPRFDRLVRSATRLADSPTPEIVLALSSLAVGIAVLFGYVPVSGISRHDGLSAAQIWYVLTDLPLFQFLLWRSLWRWAIWVRILGGLWRIPLDLVPTHPDRRGGISFLRWPSVGYCAMLLFAISSVLCAEWGGRFAFGGTLSSFKPLLAVFATVGSLVAFGPLLLFTGQLVRARRIGINEYGGLAAHYGRRFRRLWVQGGDRDSIPRADEMDALTGIAESYRETLDRMRPLLFDLRDLVVLLVATLLPVVPVMLANIPAEDWHELLGLLTGGRL